MCLFIARSARESHVVAVGLGVLVVCVEGLDAEVEWCAVDVRFGQVVDEFCVADLQRLFAGVWSHLERILVAEVVDLERWVDLHHERIVGRAAQRELAVVVGALLVHRVVDG